MLCYHNGIWQKGIKAVVNTLNQIKFYLCSTSRTQGIIRRCSDDDSNLMWSFQVAEQEKWNLKTRIKQLDKSFQLLINIHVKLWFYSSRSHHSAVERILEWGTFGQWSVKRKFVSGVQNQHQSVPEPKETKITIKTHQIFFSNTEITSFWHILWHIFFTSAPSNGLTGLLDSGLQPSKIQTLLISLLMASAVIQSFAFVAAPLPAHFLFVKSESFCWKDEI